MRQNIISISGTNTKVIIIINQKVSCFAAYENDIPHTVEDTKRIANNIYFRLTVEFAKLLKVVGMDQRKETGIIEKRRHLITFHSLRRFAYSIINDQTNTAFAEFILGHSRFSIPYPKAGSNKESLSYKVYDCINCS